MCTCFLAQRGVVVIVSFSELKTCFQRWKKNVLPQQLPATNRSCPGRVLHGRAFNHAYTQQNHPRHHDTSSVVGKSFVAVNIAWFKAVSILQLLQTLTASFSFRLLHEQKGLLRHQLPVTEVDGSAHQHFDPFVFRETHAQVDGAFLKVQQIEVNALVELAVVECEVELAWRIEEHDLVVGV